MLRRGASALARRFSCSQGQGSVGQWGGASAEGRAGGIFKSEATASRGCRCNSGGPGPQEAQTQRTVPSSGGPSGSEGRGGRGQTFWTGFAATCALAAGTLYWYKTERERILRQRIEKSGGKTVGKALIGGPFELVDSRDGKTPFSDRDLLGEFSLLYFGFTHCPDICPDELEKICEAANLVERQVGVKVQLVFITIDPQRDHAKQVKAYCEEFHPRLIGLTGNEEAVARACRAYRVYHHRTNDDPKDYLVDHSIITYCLDPQGSFLAFYGKNSTKEDVAKSLVELIQAYAKDHPEYTVPKPA